MGRVSDAMQRAGQDPGRPESGDSNLFTVGEEVSAHAEASDPPPAGGAEPVPPRGHLMRRDARILPIRVSHRAPDGDIRFADAVRALVRRVWLILAIVALSVGAAAAFNQWATPRYQARARLLVESNSPDVVPFRGVTEDQGRLDYYLTQLEVLRSRTLARRTLEKLEMLTPDPARQPRQVSLLLAGLAVAPVQSTMGDSRVINVAVTNSDPNLAARLANGVAEAYIEQNLETRRQGSRDASAWLSQRLGELRSEVATREAALQTYREQKDSVSLGEDQNNITLQKLGQLNSLVTNARTDRLEKQAVYDQLKDIQAEGRPLDTFSPVLANSFIQGLKADLASLHRDRERLSQQLGPLHPDMVKADAAIQTATNRLNDEMAKVVAGVQNDYKAAEAKERSFADALESQKREVLRLNQASIGYTTLQRDAASTQQMLQTVLQRMKEMDVSAELQSNNARLLDRAEVPATPVWPRRQLNLLVATLGGLFLALVCAFSLEYLKPRIATATDISEVLGVPLLGATPRIRGLKQRLAHDDLPASFQEALRGIRTRLLLSPIPGAARSITVTSTSAGEGKTIVATNLAMSIAMTGRRVLLVDADTRRPQLHSIFNVSRAPGLTDVMIGDSKPTDALIEGPVKGLFLLPAGVAVPNPTDLLDSGRLSHLIRGFTHVFDTVVLDCPPVNGVADAAIVANCTASVLFVVGSGVTSPEAARSALERMAAVQAEIVGVVLNKAKTSARDTYTYIQAEVVS